MTLLYFVGSTDSVVAWSNIGLVLLGLVGVIGLLGAVSAYFYKGRADALIGLQEKEIKVLQDQNKALKEQNAKLMEDRLEFLAEQKRMRKEIQTLRSVITQPKQYNAMIKTLAAQHTEVIDKLTSIAEGLINNGTH